MAQVGGSHYEDMAIEPWEIIDKNDLDFWEGNILKYILRHRTKNGLEDLLKARDYLNYLINREAGKGVPIVPSSKQSSGLVSSGERGTLYNSIGAVPAAVGIPDSKER